MYRRLIFLLALLILPVVAADTFTENFESYDVQGFTPESADQDWYDYVESAAIGEVSQSGPDIIGTQHMYFNAETTTDASGRQAAFSLEVPAQLLETTFYIQGEPVDNSTSGSQQYIKVESSAPIRTMVEFFLFCTNSTYGDGCELRVRFENVDTTGQVLINASLNITQFKIRIVPDWLTAEFTLYVNDVNDGEFPFLELPVDIGRILIGQQRGDIPLNMSFDDWTVIGTVNGSGDSEVDVVNGIKNFATDIRFTTSGSKFFLGLLLFIVLCAAVIVPLLALGLDNTVVPAIGFFVILVALWLIEIEFWPDWIGIALIILVAALIGTITRRLFLGIRDASQGPGLVAGSLGYFIIATSLLAFSGYATESVTIPSGSVEEEGAADQGFIEQTTECIFTLYQDCSRQTESSTWKTITDVFGWIRASFDFLFQLLTFSLPIPVIFNVMIVFPPAAALATFAIQTIRGASS